MAAPGKKAPAQAEAPVITIEKISPSLRGLIQFIGDIIPDPQNARRHPPRNIELLKGSLGYYGQQKPIVVHEKTRVCKAGNGLLMAAAALGWKVIAVAFMDDEEIKANGYAIMDNRSGELSEWDFSALGVQMKAQELAGAPLDMLGFDAGERALFAAGDNGGSQTGKGGGSNEPQPPPVPGATPGQRYLVYLSFKTWEEAHDWVEANMPEREYRPNSRSLVVDMSPEE